MSLRSQEARNAKEIELRVAGREHGLCRGEPSAELPTTSSSIDVPFALDDVRYATENDAEPLEVDRLEDPTVDADHGELAALPLDEGGGDGEDGDAPVEVVRGAINLGE